MYKYIKSKLIGITGGIGSGKTSAANVIKTQGFPVYFSDIRAKELANENSELKTKIITLLGKEAYDRENQYNRKWVGEQIFHRPNLLAQLNSLIHPVVRIDFQQWLDRQNAPLVFKETALLFELNLDKKCYKSLLVTADDKLRIKRAMNRDGKTQAEIEAIIQKQMPEEEKIKRADYVIYNNSDFNNLEKQTLKILDKLSFPAEI